MMFCPNCESQDVTVSRISIDAAQIGLPTGRLDNVERIECAECGESSTNVPAHGAVVRELRQQLVQLDRPITPAEFAFLRRSLGMSGREYADALGVSNVTISRVENSEAVPAIQQAAIKAVTLLDLLSIDGVRAFVGKRVTEIVVDVLAVERSAPRDISHGWQEISSRPRSADVIVFPRQRPRSSSAVTGLAVEFTQTEVRHVSCR